MRLIDADAIKLEKGFFEKVNNVPKFYEWLSEQPTIDPVNWIPVRKKLPLGSYSDLVIVSIHDDSGDTPFDYTSSGWVTTDGEYWIVDNEINYHVVAWMPLPEPWREEDGNI